MQKDSSQAKRMVPKPLRREHTRRRLLDAAQRLFAREGYDGTTVDDIAREAGFSKGAYYFHFASKDDALLALVEGWAEDRTRRLQAAIAGGPPELAMPLILEVLATGAEDGRLTLEFWSQGARKRKVRRLLHEAYRSWRQLLVRTFVGAQEAGITPPDAKPAAAAEAALAFHDGLVVQRALALPGSPATAGYEAIAELSAALQAALRHVGQTVPAAV